MRFSDAVATGRVLARPGTCYFVDKDRDGGTIACAIGMATLAVGIVRTDYRVKWPWLLEQTFGARPCGCKRPKNGYNDYACDIAHIFDRHIFSKEDWTLDQLIDWVRSVEPAEDVPSGTGALAENAARAEVGAKG